ncbi:MAG: GH140 [uncultured Thermomicrobiales bacterium]|uniref:GH140 n=1 Tax=uncultured Thermomicrobiales bacterium TaxID=1645740 RepID=A0A6N3IPH4_9BACT|nr:MAG: GH140 [uncultured Thermomicrobiales bacterium]
MLKVSDNQRFLVHDDGTPFFYLGDTGWAVIQRLDREEVGRYLRDRAERGFTAIQTVGISEFDGLTVPNPYGDLPFTDMDPTKPNDAYFRHIDFIVEQAAALHLHVALLPTWGDKVGPVGWGTGPEVFTPQNAEVYGRYLGGRYRDAPIIWVIGGDRTPKDEHHFATWRALAAGLDAGDGGRHLMTFHPQGRLSSSSAFHADDWLDFNMIQSGHRRRDFSNYEMVASDYALAPTKPTLDGEPCYEDHPVVDGEGYFDEYDARRAAYWALFAGAFGHTYGANGIFQCWRPGLEDRFGVRRPWDEALQLPGADQMRHARALLESRPFLDRIPDQSLIVGDPGGGADHRRATRAADGGYALIYSPTGLPFAADLSALSGERVVAHWYDPRTGSAGEAGAFTTGATHDFTPPSSGHGNDWVLVLDDPARNFPPPGQVG